MSSDLVEKLKQQAKTGFELQKEFGWIYWTGENWVSEKLVLELLEQADKDFIDLQTGTKILFKKNVELEGRLEAIRKCKSDLENLKAHWDLDKEAGYRIDEELYVIVSRLLAALAVLGEEGEAEK